MDNWIKQYLEYTKHSESSELFRLWVAISTVASCLQRKCRTFWCNGWLYPNLYIVLVGPSGMARKGTALNPAIDLMQETGIAVCAQAITPEALVNAMIESGAVHEMPDNTIMEHSSLTIVSSELTVFTGYKNLMMLANLCDWYDCTNKWIKRTRGKGIETVSGVWLNLLGATTPTTLQDALPQEAAEGGFMSRTFFVFSDARVRRISPIRIQEHDERYRTELLRTALITGMQRMLMLKGEFISSREYNEVFSQWYITSCDKVPALKDPRFKPYIGRRAAHVMKISMICSAARNSSMDLLPEDFYTALKYVEAAEELMWRIFEGFGTSDIAMLQHQVYEFIAEHSSHSVPMSQILERFHNHMDHETLKRVLANLDARGLIRYHQPDNKTWFVEITKEMSK